MVYGRNERYARFVEREKDYSDCGSVTARAMYLSPLEAHLTHCTELIQRWGAAQIEPFLAKFIGWTRDGRKGFPLDGISDLLLVSKLRWLSPAQRRVWSCYLSRAF